ncbi:MAG: hypothetical protein SOZ00_01200 [Tidjanibacter sp.]|nr:hypothetical protein [Tidjanibacter sp.]
MSLKGLSFKEWLLIGVAFVWLIANLNFSATSEQEPYFKIRKIESSQQQIAEGKVKHQQRQINNKRKLFWNKGKNYTEPRLEIKELERFAPEELVLGVVPKPKYAFLNNLSPRNSLAAWRSIVGGEYKESKSIPDNVRWGFWTPIFVLLLLGGCLLLGGNIFTSLRRELRELPAVDEAPEEEDEENDEEEEETVEEGEE